MIPISLTIQGLLSYGEEAQTIDFTALTRHKLFGIFGKVGSGKTAIIDAITLALYGVSERLRASGESSADMIHIGGNSFLIEFVVATDIRTPNETFKFVAEGERVGSQLLLRRSCFRFLPDTEEQWQLIPNATAKDILGFEYVNFKRTVLLPQAQFNEFLHLSGADRTSMLGDLFNIRRFDLYPLIKQRRQAFKDRLRNAQDKLAKFADVQPDTLQEKLQEQLQFDEDIRTCEVNIEAWTATTERFSAYADIFERIEKQRKSIAQMEQKIPDMQKRQEHLNRYKICVEQFQRDYHEEARLREQIALLEFELGKAQKKYSDMLIAVKKESAHEKNSLSSLRDMHGTAEELNFILKLKKNEEEFTQCAQAIAKAHKDYASAEEDFRRSEQQLQLLEVELKGSEEDFPSAGELSHIAAWFTKKKDLIAEQHRIAQHQEELRRKIQEKEFSIAKLFSSIDKNLQIEPSTTAWRTFIEQRDRELKENTERLYQLREDAKVHVRIHEFVRHLQDGKPCPLCGSTEHPGKQLKAHPASALKALQAELDENHKHTQIFEAARRRYEVFEAERETLLQQLQSLRQESNNAETLLQQHTEQFPSSHFTPDDEEKVLQIFAKEQEFRQHRKELRRKRDTAEQSLRQALRTKERSGITLANASADRARLQLRKQRLLEVFSLVRPADYEYMSADEVAAARQDLLKRIEEQERLFHSADDHARRLEIELVRTEMFIRQQSRAIYELQESLDALHDRITADMQAYNITSIEEVLAHPVDISAEERDLTAFEVELASARAQLDELQKLTATLDCNEATFATMKKDLEKEKLRLKQLYRSRADLINSIERIQQALRDREQLEEEKILAEEHFNVFSKLNDTFSHNKFMKFLCGKILNKLCDNANERFRVFTKGMMELVALPENAIGIRDIANNSLRSVHTLSGGQTFQAALALALSLAETLRDSDYGKQRFFFLDEGLGSLDSEAAEQVFSALAELTKQQICVGFVAHVESLKDRVPAALIVHRQPGKSSVVSLMA